MYHLYVALQFLTRLPVAKDLNPSASDLEKSGNYFPLVGAILGIIASLFFYILVFIGVDEAIAIVLMLFLLGLLTGAFHEDGLADTFDGLGGAFEPQKKLEIMKDSRLGTYGAAALVGIYLIRFQTLSISLEKGIAISLIVALMFARLSSIVLITYMEYSGLDLKTKSKPLIKSLGKNGFKIPLIYTVLVSIALTGVLNTLLILVLLSCIIYLARIFFTKQIGGLTGDLLGCVNIICELAVLIILSIK